MKLTKSIFLAVFLAGCSLRAEAGGVISSGGDAYAAQFVRVGEEVSKMLKRKPVSGIDGAAFEMALKTTHIYTKNRVFLKKREVDAINTPARKRITLSRKRWDSLANQPRSRIVLVAHEYFGVMGLNDKNYVISKALFEDLGVALYRYDCTLFSAPGLDEIRMIATIYREFADVSFVDKEGQPWSSEIQSFYSYLIDGQLRPDNSVNFTLLVSVNMALWTQMISLPYASQVSGEKPTEVIAKSIRVTDIAPMQSEREDLSCQLTRL